MSTADNAIEALRELLALFESVAGRCDDDAPAQVVAARAVLAATPAPAPQAKPLTGLVEAIHKLPTIKANEIDGEESDGTPRYWRDRPYVSRGKLLSLLEEHGIGQGKEAKP